MSVPKCLLLVEDHTDSREALSMILSRRGYEVLEAVDVHTATSIGTSTMFDLLICDIGLPDGTGLDVLRALRSVKEFPAIALTAHVHPADIASLLACGFDRHIAKPYRLNNLMSTIETLLGMSEAAHDIVKAVPEV